MSSVPLSPLFGTEACWCCPATRCYKIKKILLVKWGVGKPSPIYISWFIYQGITCENPLQFLKPFEHSNICNL